MVQTTKRGRWWRRLLVALVVLALGDQVVLYTVLADGVLLGTPVAPFGSPLASERQRATLDALADELAHDRAAFDRRTQFDPDLGWCVPRGGTQGGATFDWAGSRIGTGPLPRERAEGERLIALVGCSFTLGSEVGDGETWAALVDARRPDARVGNFGVGGYGPDQALLRYRRDVAPLEPDEVWLGFYPGAALRASSAHPPLYYRWFARTIFFKPRFSLDAAGGLVLHPSPARDPADVVRLLRDGRAYLDALEGDPWIERARPAYLPPGTHWTHRSALARVAVTLVARGGRDVAPLLADESGGLFRLNRALVLALAREVEAAGARFRLLVLPSGLELEELRRRGDGYWRPLAARLRADGVEVLDVTDALVAAGVDGGEAWWMPGGHHAPRTHALVADAIDAAWGAR